MMNLRLLRKEPEVTLDAVAKNPSIVEGLSVEQMRPLMADLEMASGALRSRWFIVSTQAVLATPREQVVLPDRMLHVDEAARRIGIAVDTLYRNADEYPFTRRPRPRCLRFSEQGIEEYLRLRQGVAK